MPLIFTIIMGIFSLYALYMLYFLTGLYRLKKQPKMYTTVEDTVSVIIAARNEDDNLSELIQDLVNQDYNKNKLEIVIADDRSTDNTWEIIEKYSNRYSNINGVRISKKDNDMTPKKNALTKAIENSSGNIIISTDADCRVPKNWVKSIVQQFDSETGVVIGYSKVNADVKSFFQNYQLLDFFTLMSANAGSFGWGISWTGSGQNIAYTRDAFNKITGFTASRYVSPAS